MVEKSMWNPRMEKISREELKELQWKRLQHQLNHAYVNAKFIHEKFDEANLKPSDVKSLDDFSKKVPIMNKEMLREYRNKTGDPFGGILAVPLEEVAVVPRSTGTTGKPTFIPASVRDVDRLAEMWARGFWAVGVRPGQKVTDWIYTWHSWEWMCWAGFKKIGAASLHLDGYPMFNEPNLEASATYKAEVLLIPTLPLINLTQLIREKGIDIKKYWPELKSVLHAGDILSKPILEDLRKTWGEVEVYSTGGSGDPYHMTYACKPYSETMHFPEDFYYPEIVDPETLETVSTGERGNLVITPLWNEALPYIRWDQEDLVEPYFEPCECGRTLARFLYLGRTVWSVKVREKRIAMRDVEDIVYSFPEVLGKPYQLVGLKQQPQENLIVRVAATQQTLTNIKKKLEEELKVPTNMEQISAEEVKVMPHKLVKFVKRS